MENTGIDVGTSLSWGGGEYYVHVTQGVYQVIHSDDPVVPIIHAHQFYLLVRDENKDDDSDDDNKENEVGVVRVFIIITQQLYFLVHYTLYICVWKWYGIDRHYHSVMYM